MMRSLYSAVSGLRTHQVRMDVIGDNIANVNTPGFKRARVTFKDVFYQTLRGGSEPQGDRGGTSPQQVGLGSALSSIDIIHSQGAAAATGNGTDVMIQGDGFFVLGDNAGNIFYTRAGAFGFDADGNLVNPANGLFVLDTGGNIINLDPNNQGYSIDTLGNVNYVDAAGQPQTAGQIAVAKFPNPAGLEKDGSNLYRWTPAAGDEAGGAGNNGGPPGQDGRGTIIPSALEMSNVELAMEFTEMIITQRGFQANARTITTSDEMLQELTNLKR